MRKRYIAAVALLSHCDGQIVVALLQLAYMFVAATHVYIHICVCVWLVIDKWPLHDTVVMRQECGCADRCACCIRRDCVI